MDSSVKQVVVEEQLVSPCDLQEPEVCCTGCCSPGSCCWPCAVCCAKCCAKCCLPQCCQCPSCPSCLSCPGCRGCPGCPSCPGCPGCPGCCGCLKQALCCVPRLLCYLPRKLLCCRQLKCLLIVVVVVVLLVLIIAGILLMRLHADQWHTSAVLRMGMWRGPAWEENVATFYLDGGDGNPATVIYDYKNLLVSYRSQLHRTCYVTYMDQDNIPGLDTAAETFQHREAEKRLAMPLADRSLLGTTASILCASIPIYWA